MKVWSSTSMSLTSWSRFSPISEPRFSSSRSFQFQRGRKEEIRELTFRASRQLHGHHPSPSQWVETVWNRRLHNMDKKIFCMSLKTNKGRNKQANECRGARGVISVTNSAEQAVQSKQCRVSSVEQAVRNKRMSEQCKQISKSIYKQITLYSAGRFLSHSTQCASHLSRHDYSSLSASVFLPFPFSLFWM